MYSLYFNRGGARAAVLSLLPMTLALAGACLDERAHLGFSNWRSACRAAGLSVSSLLNFTFELLPTAVLGALVGGIAVQISGVYLRHRRHAAAGSLAAHGGCVLGMAVGLPLCALTLPLPLLLGVEVLLTVLGATVAFRLLHISPSCTASGLARTQRLPSA